MKTLRNTIRTLLLGFVFLCSISVWSATEVNVTKAGTLSTLLQDVTLEKELKLSGSINGTDVKYIRELLLAGKVTRLNLQDVRIVKGGVAYNESYTTANDVYSAAKYNIYRSLCFLAFGT